MPNLTNTYDLFELSIHANIKSKNMQENGFELQLELIYTVDSSTQQFSILAFTRKMTL